MVWAVLSFSDGRLRRPWGPLVVLGVAAAGLVPSPAVRALALATMGVATLLVALAGSGSDGTWPVARAASRTRAAACTAAALCMPGAGRPGHARHTVRVGRSGRADHRARLRPAPARRRARPPSAVGSWEGEEAESVIALSETEGTEWRLARLRAATVAVADAPTHPALGSAIGLLQHNLALQQELTAAVADARVSRRRLAAAMERERRMLRTRLAERALPALAELAKSVEHVDGHDLDESGRRVLEQCRSEVSAIAEDLEGSVRRSAPSGVVARRPQRFRRDRRAQCQCLGSSTCPTPASTRHRGGLVVLLQRGPGECGQARQFDLRHGVGDGRWRPGCGGDP